LQYDTNLKVHPPLRTQQDMFALRQGLEDGSIDCIATHHLPQDWDNKTSEFEYAEPGIIGLETCFSIVNKILPKLSCPRLADILSNNAREIFSLNRHPIDINSVADITLFERDTETKYDAASIKSKSKNTPFINKGLKGKVIGIINKDKLYLNN
jgi:dihydroorotase